MPCGGTTGSSDASIASMAPAWPVGMGDGGAGAGTPTGIGAVAGGGRLLAVTQVEAMPVQARLRRVPFPRDRPASRISPGRQPAELLRFVPVRSQAACAPARRVQRADPGLLRQLSTAVAAGKYCDNQRPFEAKPWAH